MGHFKLSSCLIKSGNAWEDTSLTCSDVSLWVYSQLDEGQWQDVTEMRRIEREGQKGKDLYGSCWWFCPHLFLFIFFFFHPFSCQHCLWLLMFLTLIKAKRDHSFGELSISSIWHFVCFLFLSLLSVVAYRNSTMSYAVILRQCSYQWFTI